MLKQVMFSVFVLFTAISSHAITKPEEAVQEMVTKLKQAGDYAVLLDYVHWETAFTQMSAQEKQALQAQNPSQLKTVVKEFLISPKKAILSKVGKDMEALPSEQKEMMTKMLTQQAEQIQTERAKRNQEIKRTEFKVGNAKVNGSRASVEVTELLDGQSKTRNIDLVLIANRWWLPSSDFAQKKQAPAPAVGSGQF